MLEFQNISILIFIFLYLSCSESTKPEESDINLEAKITGIEAKNNTSDTVYYFIIESQFSNLVDWIPVFSGPYIEKKESVLIPYTEIENGKDAPVQTGDEIDFYWWTDEDRENPMVRRSSISLQ